MSCDIKINESKTLIPPDGGWGWVICMAYALNNVIVLPLISGFGLIFQETFSNLGISATQGAFIITFNHGLGMLLSLFNRPLHRRFSYRKVALVGVTFVSLGIFITAVGRSFLHIFIGYTLMTSIGIALTMSSFHLAINSYFKFNRGKAMAVGMSITGLGPIFMPQVINFLLDALGTQGAVIVLGALTLHSYVAALLLRPVKWYMKPDENAENLVEKDKNDTDERSSRNIELQDLSKSMSHLTENDDDYLEDKKNVRISMRSLDKINGELPNGNTDQTKSNTNTQNAEEVSNENKSTRKWWEASITEVNLGSCINIFEDRVRKLSADIHGSKRSINSILRGVSTSPDGNPLLDEEEKTITETNKVKVENDKAASTVKMVHYFDSALLKDPIFVNIMIGIAIAACAEISFTLLTPFILSDLTFTTSEIAGVMSLIASCDILFRFISPFIGDWCHKSVRVMYIISLIMLIFTRSGLFFASSYQTMIVVAIALGVAKGVRSVYVSLVLPNYVSVDRLAFASGLQMISNSVVLICIGPLQGLLKDYSGSYANSVIFINALTFVTVVLWSLEYLYLKVKPRNKTT